MNTQELETKRSAYSEVKMVTAREALRRQVRPIVVPENAELLFSPSHPDLANCFVRVRLESYEDLQLLGCVPRKLHEEKLRQAIATDDEEVYKLAISMVSRLPAPGCDCHQSTPARSTFTRSLRAAYNRTRITHNPALGRLLSDHLGAHIPWDDPLASITRRWVSRLSDKVFVDKPFLAAFSEDITINRNATLLADPALQSLLAHNIWIHRRGRLVVDGSYMKIWATSVGSFLDFNILSTTARIAPPWTIAGN